MTNLSDFLKVKKVRLLTDGYTNLNKGSEYNLVRLEVVISNNAGIEGRYPLDSFEPVIDSAENPLQDMKLTPEFEAVEPKFKVGDKVYVGLTGKIAQVTEIIDDDVVNVANKNNEVRAWVSNICHATTENYERLQATFQHINFEAPPKPLTGSEPLMQRDRIIQAVNTLTDICHSASRNAGWWHDIKTGESLKRNKGEMLMLMVSELAEAMEADRKSLQDDHLPQYDGVSVEIADCLIRIFDFVGGFGLKTAEAMADKIEYNANRADHKIENRLKDNGKKY